MTHTAQGTNTMRKLQTGFTMIEIMIVVAIVGILAAIALPSYTDYITRSRIAETTAALSDFRTRMEQYYQDNRTYVCGAATAPLPGNTTNWTYACAVTNGGQGYTLTSTGAATNTTGFSYSIDHLNTQRTLGVKTGWGTAPAARWITKKGG